MLELVEDNVIISRQTWDELKSDSYFSEIIDVIEEREALLKAKSNTTSFIDLEDYHKERMSKQNV